MSMLDTIVGQFGIAVGAAVTAFTLIKMNKDYQDRKLNETRANAMELRAGKTEIASLYETIANLRKEREAIIREFDLKFKGMAEDIDKMERAIHEGDRQAIEECHQMRNHLNEFIKDTWKLFLK